MTLDIEGVLRDHVVHGGSSGGRWNADCLAVDCHWSAHGETGGFWATVEAHRAHVAAVLREQIAVAIEAEADAVAHEHAWVRRRNVTSSGYELPPYETCACGSARPA